MWDSGFRDRRRRPNKGSRALLPERVSSCPGGASQPVSWLVLSGSLDSGLSPEALGHAACLVFHHVLCLVLEPRVSKACPHSLSAISAFLFQESRAW